MTAAKTVMTNAEWRAEGFYRFGTEDVMQWKFRCVACWTESSPADFKALGADPHRAAHECIGRVHNELGGLPGRAVDSDSTTCNWIAGGLIRLSTLIEVEGIKGRPTLAFPFADYIGGEPADAEAVAR